MTLRNLTHAAVFLAAAAAPVAPPIVASPAQAQDLDFGDILPRAPRVDPVGDLSHGALVFHGNYCGPGSRGVGLPPTDALDAACMHHDACSPPPGGVPSCGCNARLRRESWAVAMSPRYPDDLRSLAGFVSQTASVLPCGRG